MSDKTAGGNDEKSSTGMLAGLSVWFMNAVKGTHPESYRKGVAFGYLKGKEAAQSLPPKQAAPLEVTVRLEDARGGLSPHVRFDPLLLDDGRLKIPPSAVSQFKADALVNLGEDHQPTEEQWKAILSPTTSSVTIGIAGTGKTFVMMLRAVFLHVYLQYPLEEMTILAVTKDTRFELIAELARLFARWGVDLSREQGLELVKTPRGALLQVIRAVPPLREVVPFELLGMLDAGDEDGRPFDTRLTSEQLALVEGAYQSAYLASATFAKSVQELFADTVALPRASSDNPQLVRYSEIGNARLQHDEVLTKAVTSIWHSAGHWPIPEVAPQLAQVSVMGQAVHTNGYVPQLDAHIVLGLPKETARDFCRPGSDLSLYEECLGKRAFLQRFAGQRIIWFDSQEQLVDLIDSLRSMTHSAPKFMARVKGLERPMGIAECMFQTGALIETLGLNPPEAISQLNFMPTDPDAKFFECAAKFWPHFEEHLMTGTPQVITINRLLLTFGSQGHHNLKAVPTENLRRLRNILTDELQDVTTETGEFIKAVMRENRHRIEVEGIKDAALSIFAAGDDFQTAHGTQGATPKYLIRFQSHFKSKGFERNLLGVNFRSQQGIIYSAHAMVLGIPAVSMLAPASAVNEKSTLAEVHNLSASTFMSLFNKHYAAGDNILILAANPEDYRLSEAFVNVVVEQDKMENPTERRVRVRAAQRSKGLEADTVFILGDFVAATSTWAKNQLFRAARTLETDDQSPFDVIVQNELYRQTHISLSRAKHYAYWLLGKEASDGVHRLRASSRIETVPGSFIDCR
ncbi:hypothetical protein NPS53_08205 [Pseudomonas putida]|uniref:hypothetical protein n=1 Tax=Pseudomonas putida TaxID=303 RepID=UPI00236444D8|nr:hypothetical protein [Pseudomonas putida]MDD2139553.1 hypothetical protein [Pseudomonas putida]HDS1721476.1 hypothetical protein [Pseudomonas putida]